MGITSSCPRKEMEKLLFKQRDRVLLLSVVLSSLDLFNFEQRLSFGVLFIHIQANTYWMWLYEK